MPTKSRKRKLTKRNPVAKAMRKLRPQVVPDRRRKKLARAEKREAEEALNKPE
jgi:hypothetical protein